MAKTPSKEVLEFLVAVSPSFKEWWSEGEHTSDDKTSHRIMSEFAQYFAQSHKSFNEKQLQKLGSWISEAVTRNDDLENAICTCFLEHSRQLGVNRVLAPYLSRVAKDKSHP